MKLSKITAAVLLASATFVANASVAHPWLVRLRGIAVVPQVSSTTIQSINGNVTHISNRVIPELDINYFFTTHISTEVILATTKHAATATGTALERVYLGTVRLLPPTVTAVYHFFPNSPLKPYLGLGVNYTYFYHARPATATRLNYRSSFGPAFEAGMDYQIGPHFVANVDVKKIMIKTKVTGAAGAVPLSTTVKVNPWLFGAGVGYRF